MEQGRYDVLESVPRYGMDPQIKYFHTACVTDNLAEAVLLPDAE
jgi:hypothetical protein